MGRYAYEKFRMEFSADLQYRITREIGMYYDIDANDFDWTVIDLRVKRADMQQRYRFADTVRKLEAYLQTLKAEPDYNKDKPIVLTASEAAEITGRNRKTIADWNRKGLLATGGSGKIKRIDVKKTIEKLKKYKNFAVDFCLSLDIFAKREKILQTNEKRFSESLFIY